MEMVGLGDRGDHYPYQLSGGEQQRVSIARALSKDPKILLADEPTGELDYTTGKKILELLVSFANEGRAVLIVTHNKELGKIAHRILHLKDGRIVKEVKNERPMPVANLEW
jgi:putative ABC transport system ATP-binding protein